MKNVVYHIHAIDLSNWLHRAYHVVRPEDMMVNGKPTGAVKVFINMVESLLGKIRETKKKGEKHHLVFAVDCSRVKSWRYLMVKPWAEERADELGVPPQELYYKGKRTTDQEKREALRFQSKLLLEMLETSGFPCIGDHDAEADDILGTIARNFSKRPNVVVHIHTRDKDAAQLLIYPNTEIVHPAIGQSPERILRSSQDCIDVYGVPPERIVDYLAMCGDVADNVPGIPGVGEKTAIKLISKFGSFSQVIENPEAVKSVKALREGNLPMSPEMLISLIKLDCRIKSVPKKASAFERAKLTEERIAAMTKLRRKYKFNSLFGA